VDFASRENTCLCFLFILSVGCVRLGRYRSWFILVPTDYRFDSNLQELVDSVPAIAVQSTESSVNAGAMDTDHVQGNDNSCSSSRVSGLLLYYWLLFIFTTDASKCNPYISLELCVCLSITIYILHVVQML